MGKLGSLWRMKGAVVVSSLISFLAMIHRFLLYVL